MTTTDLQSLLTCPAFGADGEPTGAVNTLLDAAKEDAWVESYLRGLLGRPDVQLTVQDRARFVLFIVQHEHLLADLKSRGWS